MTEMAELNGLQNRLPKAEAWLVKARQWQQRNPTAELASVRRPKLWRIQYLNVGLAVRRGKLEEAAQALPLLMPVEVETALWNGSETAESHRMRYGPAGLESLLKAEGWELKAEQ